MTSAGVWIFSEPIVALSAEGTAAELGRAVLAALDRSRSPVPHPDQDDWVHLGKSLYTAAGVKSWRAFSVSAELVSAEEEGDRIALMPWRNLGPKDGFEPDPSRQVFVTRNDPAQVGETAAELLRTSP
jgi:hypothetical protein